MRHLSNLKYQNATKNRLPFASNTWVVLSFCNTSSGPSCIFYSSFELYLKMYSALYFKVNEWPGFFYIYKQNLWLSQVYFRVYNLYFLRNRPVFARTCMTCNSECRWTAWRVVLCCVCAWMPSPTTRGSSLHSVSYSLFSVSQFTFQNQ